MKAGVFFAVVVSACMVCAGGRCPRWISVMPLHGGRAQELAEDAAELGNATFIDGIAWSCAVNPEGDPATDRAAVYSRRYRQTAPLLRARSSVAQGILLQATMGHGGYPGTSTPWQLAVKPDGTSVYRMCPMDERFLAYIAQACRTFAELKPDFFMVDDDTRLVWKEMPGCFCPLHLAEFAKRTGRDWTREQVVAMLKGGDSLEAETWKAVKADSLRRFFRVIRENFGREIPGMLCAIGHPSHLCHVREFAQILAAPGQTPVVRGSGAPYHGRDLFHVVGMRCSYAAQMEGVGRDVVYMQECDTCPHTLWATSAQRTFDHLVMLALEGCKGAKIWITRTGNYREKKSGAAYRRLFRENRGLVEWAANVDFAQRGVVVPTGSPVNVNFGDRYLALAGIPYRFGVAKPGEITALTAETLKCLTVGQIREILSGRTLLDGSAALWLSANGYSDLIGVDAKPWNRKTIQVHEFDDGQRQVGMRTGGLADLTEARDGAKALTRLLNRPALDAELVYEAPGSLLFDNGLGGRVLAFAQSLPEQNPPCFNAEFFSEGYKGQVLRWLSTLGGGIPGRVCYLGVGPVTCESGTTSRGEEVVVLNALDLDGDAAPELVFDVWPTGIERLQGDGRWLAVPFERTPDGACRLQSPVAVQSPAIFRWNP